MTRKGYRRAKIALSILLAFFLLLFCIATGLLIASAVADRNVRFIPSYPREDITALAAKSEWTEEDYRTIYLQTGLGKAAADTLRDEGKTADLLLFPSIYDTFGLVKVEAASRRTPTVFAEGSLASKSAEHGVNGYVFPCEAEAFAAGVCEIVKDREKLREVGENAHRDLYVLWDNVIEQVLANYGEIFGGKK